MKKYVVKLVLFVVLLVGTGSFSASAQVYVTVRPAYHRIVRPAGPRGGVSGWVWIPGRWVHERRGYQWIPGRWRRG